MNLFVRKGNTPECRNAIWVERGLSFAPRNLGSKNQMIGGAVRRTSKQIRPRLSIPISISNGASASAPKTSCRKNENASLN
jgi:hypothetical protein